MGKASVLGDGAIMIKYLEYLQQRVRTLEESQTANESTGPIIEDVVEGDNGNSVKLIRLPELMGAIRVRVSGKNILLKIQCEKRKGLLGRILGQVEKLDLGVVNIGVAPFGCFSLDITIIAEMEKKFRLSTKDIVTAVRSALQAAAVEES